MRLLLLLSIYVIYLASVKQMIIVLQRTGIISAQFVLTDHALIKWASAVLFGTIIVIDINYAIKHKRDFIISAIGSFLSDE